MTPKELKLEYVRLAIAMAPFVAGRSLIDVAAEIEAFVEKTTTLRTAKAAKK